MLIVNNGYCTCVGLIMRLFAISPTHLTTSTGLHHSNQQRHGPLSDCKYQKSCLIEVPLTLMKMPLQTEGTFNCTFKEIQLKLQSVHSWKLNLYSSSRWYRLHRFECKRKKLSALTSSLITTRNYCSKLFFYKTQACLSPTDAAKTSL